MRAKQQPQLDLSFAHAATLLLPRLDETHLILVGCGGTGSWLAPAIARLAFVCKEQGRQVDVTFIDGDTVEAKNIPRQNFCEAEIGLNKAVTLANRFGAAWGLEVSAIPKMLAKGMEIVRRSALTIIVGCVDNAAARREIASLLEKRRNDAPRVYWLDCGNYPTGGQVLVGSAPDAASLKGAFKSAKTCVALPSPALQSPDLLVAKREETEAKNMSCAELTAANLQGLSVNQQVAAIAAGYLEMMLITNNLKIFSTDFSQGSMSMTSKAITPEKLAAAIGKPVEYLKG